eukprot:GFUD01019887.1.p1 GENE.GFUD01019887.1~~GFUD01019887.1.p1  ORF type:complete len:240 (-),score=43.07 GFUD01019887.1:68-787(-)
MADSAVSTFCASSQLSLRIQRRTCKILQVVLVFDVFCLLTSATLLISSCFSTDLPLDRRLLLKVGTLLGSYSSISVVCNVLASYGVRAWRRFFLLPYLIFLPMVLTIMLVYMARLLFITFGINEAILLPIISSTVMVYIWLKLLKQWFAMSKPMMATTPEFNQQDVEPEALALATAFALLHLSPDLGQDTVTTRDLPPSYETLEVDMSAPPEYDEAMFHQFYIQPVPEDEIEQDSEISV